MNALFIRSIIVRATEIRMDTIQARNPDATSGRNASDEGA